MKKLSLILLTASLVWTVQTVKAQDQDTTKNKVEVKRKVKQGVHGRTVTKIKMNGQGTPDAVKEPANGTATGHLAPKPAPEPVVVTPPPAPSPAVVVVHDTVQKNVPVAVPAPEPKTATTQVTTTTVTKPVASKTVTTHHVVASKTAYHKPVHKTYNKTAVAAPATKTVTTTTVKKTE